MGLFVFFIFLWSTRVFPLLLCIPHFDKYTLIFVFLAGFSLKYPRTLRIPQWWVLNILKWSKESCMPTNNGPWTKLGYDRGLSNSWTICFLLNFLEHIVALKFLSLFSCPESVCWDILLELLMKKWVLCMLKHRVSLKFHPNWIFLAKVTNKINLMTFSKMKNLSWIWTESYNNIDCFFLFFFLSKLWPQKWFS